MTGGEVEIVIVEDNPNDAELVVRVLKKRNLANKLVLLKDGAEAIDFLFGESGVSGTQFPKHRVASDTLRVIVLDLKLPKVDGIEVLRRIKSDERTRRIPVVVLTASAEERDLRDAYELGANSYVTKPIEFAEFARVVSEMGLYWLTLNRLPV